MSQLAHVCMLREEAQCICEDRGIMREVLVYLITTGNAPYELHQWH